MAGFQWGAFALIGEGAGDFEDKSIADEAAALSNAVDIDGKAACEVRVAVTEPDVGAPTGDVVAYIVRGSQDADDRLALGTVVTLDTQAETREGVFSVDPGKMADFKVLVENDCGQTVTVTVQARTATFGEGT